MSLIEFLETEAEIFEAVLSQRIRSFILFLTAIVVPPVLVLVALNMIEASPMPGLGEGLHPLLLLFGVGLAIKMLFEAVRTYLKDRAVLLRF